MYSQQILPPCPASPFPAPLPSSSVSSPWHFPPLYFHIICTHTVFTYLRKTQFLSFSDWVHLFTVTPSGSTNFYESNVTLFFGGKKEDCVSPFLYAFLCWRFWVSYCGQNCGKHWCASVSAVLESLWLSEGTRCQALSFSLQPHQQHVRACFCLHPQECAILPLWLGWNRISM